MTNKTTYKLLLTLKSANMNFHSKKKIKYNMNKN